MNNNFLNYRFFSFLTQNNITLATTITISIIFVIFVKSILLGFWRGFWFSLIMTILSITTSIITFTILVNIFSTYISTKLLEINLFKNNKFLIEDTTKVSLGLIVLAIIFVFYLISLLITILIVSFSRLNLKKIKKRGKKTLLNRLFGSLLAPVSIIPLSIGLINVAGVSNHENILIKNNDKILNKFSNSKIIGISKYSPILTSIFELKQNNIKSVNFNAFFATLEDGFRPDKIKFNKFENELTISLFDEFSTQEQIDSWNNLSDASKIILNNWSQTDESWNLFIKMLNSQINFSPQTQQKILIYIKQIENIIRLMLENPNSTKIKLDYFDPNKIKIFEHNISIDKQEQIVNIFSKKILSTTDKTAQNLTKKVLKVVFNFN
ncbi:hypothetical protein EG856_00160 [Mycoplasmopsis phocirhinis]|uniref:Uncharacterized protein n=1 Tax=Mycoplasmopsis phocirhinis TaxID=142650 RepID=A0A4P6MN00_9BACT|nr:hypothetical protein [Mycoplasmopsis phocirhinis]QBF34353.1 hypothetical protein EG856_00160 [Mycoplasmopsis phocirhinis]